jgi:hypothetical protein
MKEKMKTATISAVIITTMFVIGGGYANHSFAAVDVANNKSSQAVITREHAELSLGTLNNIKTITTTNNNITLGNPFYIQHDKITRQEPLLSPDGRRATGVTFSGNGTVKGISIVDSGRALIIPISNGIVEIVGEVILNATDGSLHNATLAFREIGHVNAYDKTVQGAGAIIFNANATGKLSSLSNTVAMFTDIGKEGGSNMIKAWEWKYGSASVG